MVTLQQYKEASGKFCILKVQINPSQKAAEIPHEAWMVLCKENAMMRMACTLQMHGRVSACSAVMLNDVFFEFELPLRGLPQ